MEKVLEIVSNYLEALPAIVYAMRLIHQDKEKFHPIKCTYSKDQLLNSVGFLRFKNLQGYNIYCRPIGYEFVLLDDLCRESLGDLAKLRPCLLMETSPDNYQAFLRLKQVPESRERAFQICQYLADLFGADKASAEPDHVGRLPGFTNRKPKHQRPDGKFPFVKLHKYANRVSTFTPIAGIVAQTSTPNTHQHKPYRHKANDRSREDFNLCCMLIRQKKSDEYIRQQLELRSEKAKEVKPSWDYIGKTIANARKIVANQKG